LSEGNQRNQNTFYGYCIKIDFCGGGFMEKLIDQGLLKERINSALVADLMGYIASIIKVTFRKEERRSILVIFLKFHVRF
jgi:hypothetical protein